MSLDDNALHVSARSNDAGKLRIAAVGDIHVHEQDQGKWTDFFKEVSEKADVLLLCGDLTDTGKEAEAEVLAEEIKACTIPILAVLGNHDYDHDQLKKYAKSSLKLSYSCLMAISLLSAMWVLQV
ncbi:hypothetical protein GCM10028895_46460 [Pontibacter rugosus]